MKWMSAARVVVVAASLAGIAPAAAAQEAPRRSDQFAGSLSQCRAIADAGARLACFDGAADALDAALRSKDVQIVDRADIRRARRSLFGFTLPRIGLLGGEKGESFTAIDSTVASARHLANDRVEVQLAGDGEGLWRSTDPMAFVPRTGSKIHIRKGALGNYFMSIGGENVRGMRVR